AGAVLEDQEGESRLGDVVVPPLPHRDAPVEVVRTEERLAEGSDPAVALHADAELLADRARPAVAADQVAGADDRLGPAGQPQPGRDGGGVLLERLQRAAEADADRGQRL